MKKLLSLFVLLTICLYPVFAGRNTFVKSVADFTTAWNAYGDGDTITVAYNKGTAYNVSTKNMKNTGGSLFIRGEYANKDSMPLIQMSINVVSLPTGTTCSLKFEYVHMQYKNEGTSGQLIYSNKETVGIDSLVFRHCEMSKTIRSLFRSVVATDSIKAGYINYLELSDCKVHNTMKAFDCKDYPFIMLGHLPIQVLIKNNTFYDMPYLKSILGVSLKTSENQGQNSTIDFVNNTVCLSGPNSGLINTGNYLGSETQYNFNNNLIITPNWTNSLNINIADSSFAHPKLVVTKYGLITAQNNLIENYSAWKSGQIIDENGEGAFLALDTIPQYTMKGLGVSMTDFTDPTNGNYSYLFTSKLTDSGLNGNSIGDPRWVLRFNNPMTLTASANISNAVITPSKGVYEKGQTVTVTSSTVIGYSFVCWKDNATGIVLSNEQTYKFVLNSNIDLLAYYEPLSTRTVNITISGSTTATYKVSPVRDVYYTGDVVTTTFDTHGINTFLGWSDGKTSLLTRTDTLKTDLNLTASFSAFPYIMAWDFCSFTGNNLTFSSLSANHYIDSLNVGVIKYIAADTIAPSFQTRNNKFTGDVNNCIIRKTPAAYFNHPDYFFTKISTKGYTGVRVKTKVGSDNCIYKVQKIQYSLDGKSYSDFASYTIPGDSITALNVWHNLEGVLPVEAEGRDSVFVRWVPETTSRRIYSAASDQSYEYCYISKIVINGFDDENGTSWRVNPLLKYTGGQVISSVPGVTLTLGGTNNTWTVAASTYVFGNATYVAALGGNNNPKDDGGGAFSSTAKVPTTGTFYKFAFTTSGVLDVALIINASKTTYFLENAVGLANYNGFKVDAKTYASYSIPVTAGSAYHFFCEGSKMGIMGFVFTPLTDIKKINTLTNLIYSNNGTLFIKSVKAGNASVYDLTGKIMVSVQLKEGINEIYNLRKGIYLVKVGLETSKVAL
jgi:hypothetical protein